MRTKRLVDACRRVLDRWEDDRLVAAYLYGSVLAARSRFDSDLDIAVLDRIDDRLSWDAQAKLMDELERATGWPVDLRALRDGTPSYQIHVLEQGKLIWKRDNAAVHEFAQALRQEFQQIRGETDRAWSSVLNSLAHKTGNRS